MKKGAGEYTERVVILSRSLAVADATGEEVESWPTPIPLGTGEHWAKIEAAGAGETTDATRGSFDTFTLSFRHLVDLKSVDKIRLKETGQVFDVTSAGRSRGPNGGWVTTCQIVGDGELDETAPELVSATIDATGLILTLVFDEEVTASYATFTMSALGGDGGGASVVPTWGGTGNGRETWILDLSRVVYADETITLTYGSNTIEDWAGNLLNGLIDQPVTNNSTQDLFSPADFSGLLMWLTAGPSWCFEDVGGTDPCEAGDTIAVVTDRAGNFTLSQSTAGDRPTLRLTGSDYDIRGVSDDYLTVTGTGFNGLSGFTLFLAGIADSAPAAIDTLVSLGNAAGNTVALIRRANGSNVWEGLTSLGGNYVVATSATAISTGSRFVIGMTVDPSLSSAELKLYSGVTQIASASQAGNLPATAGTMRILTDSFQPAQGWPGGIYKAVAYNRVLTALEIADIVDYLNES